MKGASSREASMSDILVSTDASRGEGIVSDSHQPGRLSDSVAKLLAAGVISNSQGSDREGSGLGVTESLEEMKAHGSSYLRGGPSQNCSISCVVTCCFPGYNSKSASAIYNYTLTQTLQGTRVKKVANTTRLHNEAASEETLYI
eukprot:4245193-Pyramimonas_sp.AAC.1